MSKRIPTVTRQLIEAAVLPLQTKTYTVIPHSDVINITEKTLEEKGFEIISDRYKCTKSAQVAQGIYYLNYGHDPEMKMMFAWSNSYDKSLRFRCAIGGSLENGSTILSGANLGSWARRHSGTALQETTDTIKAQISNSASYYQKLVDDKNFMEKITLDLKSQSEFAGRLFVELDLITSEQISDMKGWIKEDPDKNTLWNFYTYLVTVLQKSHPAKWMDCQIAAHMWICNEFKIPDTPLIIPVSEPAGEIQEPVVQEPGHQITLQESIAEVVKETGEPEVIQTGFQSLIEPVVIEKNDQGESLVSIEFGTIDIKEHVKDVNTKIKLQSTTLIEQLAQQKLEAEQDEVKQVVQETLNQVPDFGISTPGEVVFLDVESENLTVSDNKSVLQEQAEQLIIEALPTMTIPVEGEVIQTQDPNQPHIFTAESDEATECMICGKGIMDSIHDEF